MFDKLFRRPAALARQRSGPLVEERRLYLRHLSDQEISHSTLRGVAQYLLVVCDYLDLAARPGEMIGPSEIRQKADLWCAGRTKTSARHGDFRWSRRRFLRTSTQWMQFLGRLEQPQTSPKPCADLVDAFADYMRDERGLSPRTIDYRRWTVDDFLKRLGATKQRLLTLKPTEIDHALVEKITAGGYGRETVQAYASTLRSFFRYAEMHGWCRSGLAMTIMAPRVFAQERLPSAPSWDDVQRLLATTEGDHPTDIRDRAILLLLASYGLRAGEVRCLHLEDLDWEQELLFVRRDKTHEGQRYPLSRTVGNAILRYLRETRPCSTHREVFLTMRPPFRPLSSSGLWPIVARRLRPLGVRISHHGPHALRHACATHLLGQGFSLKEIGDHLGHRSPDTTRIYAKVDLVGLRQVADFDLGGLS